MADLREQDHGRFLRQLTSADREWAFWIGTELKALGHEARIHEWELSAGADIMQWMEARLHRPGDLLVPNGPLKASEPHKDKGEGAPYKGAQRRPADPTSPYPPGSSLALLTDRGYGKYSVGPGQCFISYAHGDHDGFERLLAQLK